MPGLKVRDTRDQDPLVFWRCGTKYRTVLECSAPNDKGFCQVKLMTGEVKVIHEDQLVLA